MNVTCECPAGSYVEGVTDCVPDECERCDVTEACIFGLSPENSPVFQSCGCAEGFYDDDEGGVCKPEKCKDCNMEANCNVPDASSPNEAICECGAGFVGEGNRTLGACVKDPCVRCAQFSDCSLRDDYTLESCECRDGFHGDGLVNCQLDFCKECANDRNAECLQDKPSGAASCVCKRGYTLDEATRVCVHEDVCNTCDIFSGCDVANDVVDECVCKPGTQKKSAASPCMPEVCLTCGQNSVCASTENTSSGSIPSMESFACRCKKPYVISNTTGRCVPHGCEVCSEHAECAHCLTVACAKAGADYKCACKRGYTGDGRICENTAALQGTPDSEARHLSYTIIMGTIGASLGILLLIGIIVVAHRRSQAMRTWATAANTSKFSLTELTEVAPERDDSDDEPIYSRIPEVEGRVVDGEHPKNTKTLETDLAFTVRMLSPRRDHTYTNA